MKRFPLILICFIIISVFLFPAIETTEVTNISYTSATAGGYFGAGITVINNSTNTGTIFNFARNAAASGTTNEAICWRAYPNFSPGESRYFMIPDQTYARAQWTISDYTNEVQVYHGNAYEVQDSLPDIILTHISSPPSNLSNFEIRNASALPGGVGPQVLKDGLEFMKTSILSTAQKAAFRIDYNLYMTITGGSMSEGEIIDVNSYINNAAQIYYLYIDTATVTINPDNTWTVDGTSRTGVNQRGICWSTSPNPTILDNTIIAGTGEKTFTSDMTGLLSGTTYYVRAFASTATTTLYGQELSFTTLTMVPQVTTGNVTEINPSSAVGRGNVTFEGSSPATSRGLCWSTSTNPTTANTHTINGSGTGSFTGQMAGLTPDTKYYVRAFAVNNTGTGYGSNVTFRTKKPEVTISGKITRNGTGIPGVILTFSNGAGSVQTSGGGTYNHYVPYHWTGRVTPSTLIEDFDPLSYVFVPSHREYENLLSDQPGQDFSANYLLMYLTTIKMEENSWLISKTYASIDVSVQNPGNISVSKFIIQRKTQGTDYSAIDSFSGSDLINGRYLYADKNIEKGKTCTYRVLAVYQNGTVIAVSNTGTI